MKCVPAIKTEHARENSEYGKNKTSENSEEINDDGELQEEKVFF